MWLEETLRKRKRKRKRRKGRMKIRGIKILVR